MDPLLTLEYAIAAFQSGDIEECSDLLSDYFNWRIKGGFEPHDVQVNGEYFGGDAVYDLYMMFIRRLSTVEVK